jgi:hypothetical protein
MANDLPHVTEENPYVARTLFRIDRIIWRLRGRETYWHNHLCFAIRRDGKFSHGVAVRSHFPGWVHVLASRIQNRWLWTRKVLSI